MKAALAALLLLAAPGLAVVPLVPLVEDANGDLLPDTVVWHPEPVQACAAAACAAASVALDALPGAEGLLQPVRHDGAFAATAGACPAACAALALRTFYDQAPGQQPDLTLHGMPDGGATGGAMVQAGPASAQVPLAATDTDRNNNTRVEASAPHDVGALEGDAGVVAAVLVLLHHDRGFPHTRLAYLAPFAHECLDALCAAVDLNHTYFHHDGDDDVVHEQHRVGFDDTLALGAEHCVLPCPPGLVHAGGDTGVLLEDSFFVIEPPSGVSGDGAADLLVQPPLLATPPAEADAAVAFAARDPDRDLALDEAFAEACVAGQCARLG